MSHQWCLVEHRNSGERLNWGPHVKILSLLWCEETKPPLWFWVFINYTLTIEWCCALIFLCKDILVFSKLNTLLSLLFLSLFSCTKQYVNSTLFLTYFSLFIFFLTFFSLHTFFSQPNTLVMMLSILSSSYLVNEKKSWTHVVPSNLETSLSHYLFQFPL